MSPSSARRTGPRRPMVVGTALDIDAAAQPERTTMSWTRTWLALVVVTAVFLRWLPHYGVGLLVIPVLTSAAAVVIVLSQRERTRRSVHGIRDETLAAHPLPVLLLSSLCIVVGAVGIVFVAISP